MMNRNRKFIAVPITIAKPFSQSRIAWIKKQEWYPKSFEGWPHLLNLAAFGATYWLLKKYPWMIRLGVYHVHHTEMQWFWHVGEQRRARRVLIRHLKQDRFARDVFREWLTVWRRLDVATRRARKLNYVQLSLREIGRWYVRCVSPAIEACNAFLVEALLTAGEDDWLAQEIRRAGRGRVPLIAQDDVIHVLTRSVFPSYTQEELWSRARLARLWRRGVRGKKFQQALTHHLARFDTIHGNYLHVPLITAQAVRQSLAKLDFDRLEREQRHFKGIPREKARLIRHYHLESLRPLLRAAELFVHMHDWRKWSYVKVNAVLLPMMAEVAKRMKKPRALLLHLLPAEFVALCGGGQIDWDAVRERTRGCLYEFTPKGLSLHYGKALVHFDLGWFAGKNDSNIVHGTTAMPGQARGRVRIILWPSHLHRFQVGEVLVTNNTTPEFVAVMRKAAAIVTEQGGITTHAAIISRELKIPCVIGTKVATTVLHDGDLVEVDATHGVIKKL